MMMPSLPDWKWGCLISAPLANAAQKHPAEALSWDDCSMGDIAVRYDYLKEHAQIIRKLGSQK